MFPQDSCIFSLRVYQILIRRNIPYLYVASPNTLGSFRALYLTDTFQEKKQEAANLKQRSSTPPTSKFFTNNQRKSLLKTLTPLPPAINLHLSPLSNAQENFCY